MSEWAPPQSCVSPAPAYQNFLEGQLRRIRLRVQRRLLWLREVWRSPTGAGGDPLEAQAPFPAAGAEPSSADELSFYATDPRALAIDDRIRSLEATLDCWESAAELEGNLYPITRIRRLFDLERFEVDVLYLALAPELDDGMPRLYGLAQGDLSCACATARLAGLLATDGEDRLRCLRQLASTGTLRRFGLVSLSVDATSSCMASARLTLDEYVTQVILGGKQLDPAVEATTLRVTLPDHPPNSLVLAARAAFERLCRQTGDHDLPAPVLLGGTPTTRRWVARLLADLLGLRLLELDLEHLSVTVPSSESVIRSLRREAVLSELAYFVEVPDHDDLTPSMHTLLLQITRRNDVAVIFLGGSPPGSSGVPLRIDTPRLEPGERRDLWHSALRSRGLDADASLLDAIAFDFDLDPGDADACVDASLTRAAGAIDDQLGERLRSECRRVSSVNLSELAQKVIPSHSWDDLSLPTDTLRLLRSMADDVRSQRTVYDEWGLRQKLGRSTGISALFSGPSGTGKTMAAEVLAKDVGLALMRVDLSSAVSKYVGETEKNLRRIFDRAAGGGVILFFDEADALFGKRTEVKDSHDRFANIQTNYLLQRMEEHPGVSILATNLKGHLDRSFLRRLRYVVDFVLPDRALRLAIWERIFPRTAPTAELDFAALANLELPGSSIRDIAVGAAFLAAANGKRITMRHLVIAARRELAKLERLASSRNLGRLEECGLDALDGEVFPDTEDGVSAAGGAPPS